MSFARRLKAWRLAKGMTQRSLAEKAGLPRPNLASLESGRRDCTLKTLTRLAHALGISPGQLLDKSPEAEPNLDRHQIDAVARALIDPHRKLPSNLEPIRRGVQPVVFPILRAAGIPLRISGPASTKKSRRDHVLIRLEPGLLNQLVARVNKLAANLP